MKMRPSLFLVLDLLRHDGHVIISHQRRVFDNHLWTFYLCFFSFSQFHMNRSRRILRNWIPCKPKKKTLKSDHLVVEPTLDGEWSEKVITQIFCSSNHIHMIFITIYQKTKRLEEFYPNIHSACFWYWGCDHQIKLKFRSYNQNWVFLIEPSITLRSLQGGLVWTTFIIVHLVDLIISKNTSQLSF